MWHPNLIDCEGNGELRRIITSLAVACTRTLTGKDGVRCDRRTNKLIHIWGIGQSTIPMKSKDKLTKRENYSNVLEVKKLDKPEDWASEFDKLPVMRASTVWLWHKWKNKVIRSGRREKNEFLVEFLRNLVAFACCFIVRLIVPLLTRPVNRYVALIDRESPFSNASSIWLRSSIKFGGKQVIVR